jgi:predicted DNA-binding protein (UPF0278 family)
MMSLEKIEQDIKMVMDSNIPNEEKDKIIFRLEKKYRKNGGKKSLGSIQSNK